MDVWFLIIVTACIAALLNAFFSISKPNSNLPPGPRSLPILSTVQWFRKSSVDKEKFLRKLRLKFGQIITVHLGSHPLIFISNRGLAHQALIQHGQIFADRPEEPPTGKIMSSNQHNITTAGYGPKWRLLRRNLTSQILHPSKSKKFSRARKWALEILLCRLKQGSNSHNVISANVTPTLLPGPTDLGGAQNPSSSLQQSGVVMVIDHFRFTIFSLLLFMCFGVKMDETCIREVEEVVNRQMVSSHRYQILNFWPSVTQVLLRSRWNEFLNMRKKQEEVMIPYIRSRKQVQDLEKVTCYVDTLLELELPEDGNVKRELSEGEIVTACIEFLIGGTDSTSTSLQWIMANLVKYPNIQAKLFEEIKGVIGEAEEVGEDELPKMPYLKAVVLEGLRRHPPFYFVLPHAVTQEVELGGFTVPKNAVINFVVSEMGRDPEVWEDPMEFRPERFMSSVEGELDITGNREIKMMPFGAGRRICPALGSAMLHLEYFVANLVWRFKWGVVEGKEVDLTEKEEFSNVMKNPLHAHISPR